MKNYPGYDWFTTPHWMRRFGPLKLVGGGLLDRVGLHYFTLYSVLNGLLGGVFALGGGILKKTLGAGDLMIGLFTALSVIVLLLGIFGSELVEGRDKRPYIYIFGLLSRGSFLLFFFCDGPVSFIIVATLFFVLNALVMPPVFALWQANVSTEARNRLWGITVTATTVASMTGAYLAGLALDRDPYAYKWLYPLAGIIGFIGVLILAQSPLRGRYKLDESQRPLEFRRLFIQPVTSFIRLLAEDRRFREFEIAFFFYGLALMLQFPVMPIYMVDAANMSYEQIGIASGILAQLGVLLLPPVWGMMMDRAGPLKMCAIVFAILSLFPGTMLIGHLWLGKSIPQHWIVYAAYIIMGAAMAGISVAWSLAPVYFAGNRDSSRYSGAHVTITGIRGMVGPMLGAIGVSYLGYTPVFAASTALFLAGSIGMVIVIQRNRTRQ